MSTLVRTEAADPAREVPPPTLADRLPGGFAVWLFMTMELVTFAMFAWVHAWGKRGDPLGYAQAASWVHRDVGALNTAILLVSSWSAARAVLAHRRGDHGPWWRVTAGLGLAFCAIKVSEYTELFGRGVSLSSHEFWFGYLFLTALHLLHLLVGVGFTLWLDVMGRRLAPLNRAALPVEAVAAYWHFVDLIWLLLFPTFYLLGGT